MKYPDDAEPRPEDLAKVGNDSGAAGRTIGDYVRIALQLGVSCDLRFVESLPIQAGSPTPDRLRRARELASRLNSIAGDEAG